jgi:hypothetical protein
MKITVFTAMAALSLVTANARAESEGAGDPFPFRAPGVTAVNPPGYADTGSAAFPDLTGRSAQIVIAGGPDAVPMTGSEGTVQTAASLPRGFSNGTVAYAQTQSIALSSMAHFFDGRARLAAQRSATAHQG